MTATIEKVNIFREENGRMVYWSNGNAEYFDGLRCSAKVLGTSRRRNHFSGVIK